MGKFAAYSRNKMRLTNKFCGGNSETVEAGTNGPLS
jgi:hypothetical protein